MIDRLTQIRQMQKTSWTEQKEFKKKLRRRRIVIYSTMLALILCFAYMFVWQRVFTLQLAEEHSQRKNTVRLLKEKCQALQYEVEFLSSLERIEPIAREQLAMLSQQEAQFASATVHVPQKKAVEGAAQPTAAAKPTTDNPKVTSQNETPKKQSAISKPTSKATAKATTKSNSKSNSKATSKSKKDTKPQASASKKKSGKGKK